MREYREAVVAAERLAGKFMEIRALTLFRWKVTGVVFVVVVIAMALVDLVYGPLWLWVAVLVLSALFAVFGRRREGAAGRKSVLAGPRVLTWATDPQVFVNAFRDAKLIGKDEVLRLVERMTRAGAGWAITVDLPPARKAADVIKNREASASALAVDEVQLIVERVRGAGGHAGRVAMWVADSDPYAAPALRTPLVEERRWDAWRPVPFGRDARDRRIDLPLVWTSLLIGAIPRQGKTFAARLATTGLILDPFTRLYVADFKAGKDWQAAASVAHRYLSGDESTDVLALVGVARGAGRRGPGAVPADAGPGRLDLSGVEGDPGDVTRPRAGHADHRDRHRRGTGAAGRPDTGRGRGPDDTRGGVCRGVADLAGEEGPAAGIVLMLATQRPDARTIPSGLRAVLGSRFALRVMDWRDSNIVLGEQMNARGYDSSRLLAAHKGVGILRPDGDIHAAADAVAVTVRTFFMPNEDWQAICRRGRSLRLAESTLTGHATGDDPAPMLDHVSCRGNGTTPMAERAAVELPEPLASIVEYLEELGDDGPEFVSNADLAAVLDFDPTWLGRRLAELGCRSTRERVTDDSGQSRQARGYFTAELLDTAATRNADSPDEDL